MAHRGRGDGVDAEQSVLVHLHQQRHRFGRQQRGLLPLAATELSEHAAQRGAIATVVLPAAQRRHDSRMGAAPAQRLAPLLGRSHPAERCRRQLGRGLSRRLRAPEPHACLARLARNQLVAVARRALNQRCRQSVGGSQILLLPHCCLRGGCAGSGGGGNRSKESRRRCGRRRRLLAHSSRGAIEEAQGEPRLCLEPLVARRCRGRGRCREQHLAQRLEGGQPDGEGSGVAAGGVDQVVVDAVRRDEESRLCPEGRGGACPRESANHQRVQQRGLLVGSSSAAPERCGGREDAE